MSAKPVLQVMLRVLCLPRKARHLRCGEENAQDVYFGSLHGESLQKCVWAMPLSLSPRRGSAASLPPFSQLPCTLLLQPDPAMASPLRCIAGHPAGPVSAKATLTKPLVLLGSSFRSFPFRQAFPCHRHFLSCPCRTSRLSRSLQWRMWGWAHGSDA